MKNKFIILSILILLISCNSEETNTFSAGDLTDKPEQSIAKINVKFVDSIFTKAELFADSGYTYSNKKITLLKHNLKVYFFSQNSFKRLSVLKADSAIIEDNTNDMTAFGNVEVVSDSNFTKLETSKLKWNNKERKLFSDEFVRITSPKEIIKGFGFESNEKLTYYKIYKVIGEQR